MPTKRSPAPPLPGPHPLSPLLDLLTNLPPGAKISLEKLPTGEIVVAPDDPGRKTKQQLIDERYPHLKGVGISISEAAEKYGVERKTIEKWVYRSQDVSFVNETSYPKLIDEAEVALCVDIYKRRREAGLTGFPFFDKEGFHVENVKHPHRSAKRRQGQKVLP